MSDRDVKAVLWWISLVAAPAVLIGIELFHPAGFTHSPGMYAYLSRPQPYAPAHYALDYPGPHWWFLLHMIQTPLVGLVSVGLWLLVEPAGATGAGRAFAWASRAATLVFLIYYVALDAIGGFGLARAILAVEHLTAAGRLTAEQAAGAKLLLDTLWTDPWVGGVGSFVSLTGSWAVFAAAVFAAIALRLGARAPLLPLLLLVGFGWELQTSHTSPHGPIAFALLIAAALWLGWRMRHRPASP